MKLFMYTVQYNQLSFNYFSLFDNYLINYVHNRAANKIKISTMDRDLNLLNRKPGAVPSWGWLNASDQSILKSFIADSSHSGKRLFLDSSWASFQIKNVDGNVDSLVGLTDRYDAVYFFQVDESTTSQIKATCETHDCLFKQVQPTLFYIRANGKSEDSLFAENDNVESAINHSLSQHIFNHVCLDGNANPPECGDMDTEEDRGVVDLYSSNIYSNQYINMRKVFSDGNITALATTRLLRMIINIQDFDFDAFICGSITGACIASFLSIFIKKPVLFLRNIGPDITTDDDLIVERIYPHKKYVYIFDFMCLGTEYQRIKLICALKKSSIIKSFGISHYKKPHKEKPDNIQTLFQINEFTSDKEYFVCAVDKNDLIRRGN